MADAAGDVFQRQAAFAGYPKGEGEAVLPEELLAHDEALQKADMLFIRSGFEVVRRQDNLRYSQRAPSVSAAARSLSPPAGRT